MTSYINSSINKLFSLGEPFINPDSRYEKTELLDLVVKTIGILLFIYSINSIKEVLFYVVLPIIGNESNERTSLIGILLLTLALQWFIAFLFVFKTDILTGLILKKKVMRQKTIYSRIVKKIF